MARLNTSEIRELGWGDASFGGFSWSVDGRDLLLFLTHASRPLTPLLCHWASDLRVDLVWNRPISSTLERPIRPGGPILTTGATFEAGPDDRWTVRLDFGAEGEISFECEQVTTSTEDK